MSVTYRNLSEITPGSHYAVRLAADHVRVAPVRHRPVEEVFELFPATQAAVGRRFVVEEDEPLGRQPVPRKVLHVDVPALPRRRISYWNWSTKLVHNLAINPGDDGLPSTTFSIKSPFKTGLIEIPCF